MKPHHIPSPAQKHLQVGSLVIDENLFDSIEEIQFKCKNLKELKIGKAQWPAHIDGAIWDVQTSINALETLQIIRADHSDESSDDSVQEVANDKPVFELDLKPLSANLRELKVLHINSGLQLVTPSVAPPTLEQLNKLEELRLCPLSRSCACDFTRNEWNLRILAQSSKNLRILDIRGCYLKILSLGWLVTDRLEALHLYYQVVAVSVLAKWANTLKFLTLAMVSSRFQEFRSLGPREPGDELNACLRMLASRRGVKLEQLDLQCSDCELEPLKLLVRSCEQLNYLDTRGCERLTEDLKCQFRTRSDIIGSFFGREEESSEANE